MDNKKVKKIQKQSMKYWLVDITLTSGKDLQFYVSAMTEEFAYIKATEYAEMAGGDEKLAQYYSEFSRRP